MASAMSLMNLSESVGMTTVRWIAGGNWHGESAHPRLLISAETR